MTHQPARPQPLTAEELQSLWICCGQHPSKGETIFSVLTCERLLATIDAQPPAGKVNVDALRLLLIGLILPTSKPPLGNSGFKIGPKAAQVIADAIASGLVSTTGENE